MSDHIYVLRFLSSDEFKSKSTIVDDGKYYKCVVRSRVKRKHSKFRQGVKVPFYAFVYVNSSFVEHDNTEEILKSLPYTFWAYYKFCDFSRNFKCVLMKVPRSAILDIGFVNYEELMAKEFGEPLTLDNYVSLLNKYAEENGYEAEDVEVVLSHIEKDFVVRAWDFTAWGENDADTVFKEIPVDLLFKDCPDSLTSMPMEWLTEYLRSI